MSFFGESRHLSAPALTVPSARLDAIVANAELAIRHAMHEMAINAQQLGKGAKKQRGLGLFATKRFEVAVKNNLRLIFAGLSVA